MSEKQDVFDYIDQNKDKIVDYLIEMVSIPSTCDENCTEKEVQEWLDNSLKDFGFDKVDKFAVDEKQLRPNVVAVMSGTGNGKSLLFNGHMDVVPVNNPDIWCCNPFNPVIIDGKIFGRGTSDDKGGVTSTIWAMKALKECGIKLKGDVILQAVSGEELQQAEEIGTVKCLERGYKADFGVVCEPTELELHTASSALFFFELIVEGKGVHISSRNQVIFPQHHGISSGNSVGVDAFEKSLIFVDYFKRFEQEVNHRYRDPILGAGGKPVHDKQGVGPFTINPSRIEGGEYFGSVPSRMKYTYGFWFPDQLVTKEQLIEEMKKSVAALASTDDYLKNHPPTLNAPVIQDWPGFRVDEEHPGVQTMMDSICEATEQQAVLSGFKAVCDAFYLNKYGVPSVICGPGSISHAVHGDDEYITIDNLIAATKIYACMMMDWCNR